MTSSIFGIDFENVDSVPSECNIPIKKNEYDQSAERPCCSFDKSYENLPAESKLADSSTYLMKISKDMSVYRYNSDEAKAVLKVSFFFFFFFLLFFVNTFLNYHYKKERDMRILRVKLVLNSKFVERSELIHFFLYRAI